MSNTSTPIQSKQDKLSLFAIVSAMRGQDKNWSVRIAILGIFLLGSLGLLPVVSGQLVSAQMQPTRHAISFPHLRLDEGWQTTITITNAEDRDLSLVFKAHNQKGDLVGNITPSSSNERRLLRNPDWEPSSQQLALTHLAAGETKTIRLEALPQGMESLQVESDGNVIGTAVFQSVDGKNAEALAAVRETAKMLIFPPLTTSRDLTHKSLYLFNPNHEQATAELTALDEQGNEIAWRWLPPVAAFGNRVIALSELLTDTELQNGITVKVTSDHGLAGWQMVSSPEADIVGMPALPAADKNWVLPVLSRLGEVELWTKYGIFNPGAEPAKLTVDFFDATDKHLLTVSLPDLPAGATPFFSHEFLERYVPFDAAYLSTTSDQPVQVYEIIGTKQGKGITEITGLASYAANLADIKVISGNGSDILASKQILKAWNGDKDLDNNIFKLGQENNVISIHPHNEGVSSESTYTRQVRLSSEQSVATAQSSQSLEPGLVGAWYLSFPLSGQTSTSSTINSIFDHQMTAPYTDDNITVAYTGEKGERQYDFDLVWGTHYGFKNANKTDFVVNGHYAGGGTAKYLYYDGHPGFDYRAGETTQVYASGDGTIVEVSEDTNTFYIDHGNGYRSYYLHTGTRNAKGTWSRNNMTGDVKRGDPIARVGGAPNFLPHLHFEVRKKVGNSWVVVDPYGWAGGCGDPYTKAVSTNLWVNSGTSWTFDNVGNLQGWSPYNVDCFSVANGQLSIDPKASDPYIVSPPLVNVRASDFNAVEINFSSFAPDNNGTIYFITDASPDWGEDKKVPFTVVNNGSFQTYSVRMDGHAKWTGSIIGFRIDPCNNGKPSIDSSDTIRFDTIQLKKIIGTGTPTISVSPASQSFGSVQVGSSKDLSFTVTNTGSGTLSGSASVPTPFSIVSGGSYNLGANQSQQVTVRFTPTAAQSYSQNVVFMGGGGATRSVSGVGTSPPTISVAPSNLSFGSVQVNSTKDLSFTVTNTGGGTLTGTATVAAPFSIISGGNYSLGANQSQQVVVRFSPTAAQSYSQNVNFTGGVTRQVSGTGTPAPPTISSYAWSTTPKAGQPFSGTITGTNFIVGGTQVWFCVNGTNTCYQQPSSLVNVSSSSNLSVTNGNLSSGSWQVYVQTSGGSSSRSSAFTVQAPPSPPTISGYSWSTTPRAGQPFSGTITGANFISGGTQVYFCVNGSSTCYQQPVSLVSVNSSSSLSVTNVNLSSGSWQVYVQTSAGSAARSSAFTVQPPPPAPPTISSYGWSTTPKAGQPFSGTITGMNFIAGGTQVWFCVNGTNTCYQQPSSLVSVNSSSSLSVTNVNLSTGSWQIYAQTSAGSSSRSSAFSVK